MYEELEPQMMEEEELDNAPTGEEKEDEDEDEEPGLDEEEEAI